MLNLIPHFRSFAGIVGCCAFFSSAYGQTEVDLTHLLLDRKSMEYSVDYIFDDGTVQFKIGNGIYKMRPDGSMPIDPQYYISKPTSQLGNRMTITSEQVRMTETDLELGVNYIVTTDSLIIERMYPDKANEFSKFPLPMVHHPRNTSEILRSYNIPAQTIDFLDQDHILYSEIVRDQCAETASSGKGTFKSSSYLRMITINTKTGECRQQITFVNEYEDFHEPMRQNKDHFCSLGDVWEGKKLITRVIGKGTVGLSYKTDTYVKTEGAGKLQLIGVDIETGEFSVLDEKDYKVDPEIASYRIDVMGDAIILQQSRKLDNRKFRPEMKVYSITDGKFVETNQLFPEELIAVTPGLSHVSFANLGKQKNIPFIQVTFRGERGDEPVEAFIFFFPEEIKVAQYEYKYIQYEGTYTLIGLIEQITPELNKQLNAMNCEKSIQDSMVRLKDEHLNAFTLCIWDKGGLSTNVKATAKIAQINL